MQIKKAFIIILIAITSISGYSAENFIIRDIYFKGVKRLSIEDIKPVIPIHVGDIVNKSSISKTIHILYSTGNFKNIKIFRDINNNLIINVEERPIINNIAFTGNKFIKNSILKKNFKALGITTGKVLDSSNLLKIIKILESFYDSVGKYGTYIVTNITPLANNQVNLKFEFRENKTIKNNHINIIGNHFIKTEKLVPIFKLHNQKSWWNFPGKQAYQIQKLEKDLKTLCNYYMNHGYATFHVDSTKINLTPNKKNMYITVNINEGVQYKISDIRIRSNLKDYTNNIINLIKIQPGEIYNKEKINNIIYNIKKKLGFYGYIYPSIQIKTLFDYLNNTVTLYVNIKTGKRFYVHNILFKGHYISKDIILRKEIPQIEDTWLNKDLIKQGQLNLKKLGYFEKVNVEIYPFCQNKNQVNLVYNIKERNTDAFNTNVSYGTENGVTFQVGIQKNNWLDSGYSIKINGDKNNYQTHSELSLINPYFNNTNVNFDGNVFYNNSQMDYTDILLYAQKSYGFNITWGFKLNKYSILHTGLGYIYHYLSDIQQQVMMDRYLDSINQFNYTYDIDDSFSVNDLTFNYKLIYDSLDQKLFPTHGVYFNLNGKLSTLNSDNKFYKIILDTNFYLPIDFNHKWILFEHSSYGYSNSFSQREVPFYEYFHTSNSNTIRGFQANYIGPKAVYYGSNNNINHCNKYSINEVCSSQDPIGGNAMIMNTIELITPIPFLSKNYMDLIRTSFFMDIGNIWDTKWKHTDQMKYEKIEDYSNPWNMRMSTGITLQWMSPFGLLIFTYSKPLKVFNGDKIEKFQFSIGGKTIK